MHPMIIEGVFGFIVMKKDGDGQKFSGVALPSMLSGRFIYPRGEAANDPDIHNPPPERA